MNQSKYKRQRDFKLVQIKKASIFLNYTNLKGSKSLNQSKNLKAIHSQHAI